jgi:hypothetical protein
MRERVYFIHLLEVCVGCFRPPAMMRRNIM